MLVVQQTDSTFIKNLIQVDIESFFSLLLLRTRKELSKPGRDGVFIPACFLELAFEMQM